MDMPNYCIDTILKNLKNERICLLSINQQNILLHEIISDESMNINNKKKYNDEESDRIQENKKKIKHIKINKKRYNSKDDYDTSRSHCIIFQNKIYFHKKYKYNNSFIKNSIIKLLLYL